MSLLSFFAGVLAAAVLCGGRSADSAEKSACDWPGGVAVTSVGLIAEETLQPVAFPVKSFHKLSVLHEGETVSLSV